MTEGVTVAVRLPVPEYEGELEYESTCVLVLDGVPVGVIEGDTNKEVTKEGRQGRIEGGKMV